MKKTLTANISGLVFHIDEDAYEKLNQYLGNVRRHFTPDEGCDEILADIESRIAEMLQDKTSASKQVVSLADIQEVILQLGDPSQIRGEETAEEPYRSSTTYEKTQKRLYRDPDNKYLGGVSGGLGAFFNLDPTWIRVAFVLFTFVYGFGPIVYIILWIVVPKAKTTAEKLEMRGERVTVSNIEKSIREELQDLKKNIQDFSEETKNNLKKKENPNQLENSLESVGEALGSVFRVFFRIVAVIIGVAFIFLGIFLLIGIISSLFWGPVPVTMPFGAIQLFSVPSLLELVINSQWVINLAIIGILLTIGIPLIVLIYSGLRLIFGFESRIRYFGLIAFMLWISGIALCTFVSVNALTQFSVEQTITEERILDSTPGQNIYLGTDTNMMQEISGMERFDDWDLLWLSHANKRNGIPRLRIRSTQSDTLKLTIRRESRGATHTQARDIAQGISYQYTQRDSLIVFDPVFSFDTEDGWRAQKVYLELIVPEDKVVILSPELRDVLDVRWGNTPKVIGGLEPAIRQEAHAFSGTHIQNHNVFPGSIILNLGF